MGWVGGLWWFVFRTRCQAGVQCGSVLLDSGSTIKTHGCSRYGMEAFGPVPPKPPKAHLPRMATRPNRNPYYIHWIQKGDLSQVNRQFGLVTFYMGYYNDALLFVWWNSYPPPKRQIRRYGREGVVFVWRIIMHRKPPDEVFHYLAGPIWIERAPTNALLKTERIIVLLEKRE